MEEKIRELFIIFYRNPLLGKVKPRHTAALGGENTLKVYKSLISDIEVKDDLPLSLRKSISIL